MTRVKDVYKYLNTIAPLSLQESWDNSGFLIGNENTEVSGVLVCLDATVSVTEEAKELGANLIVSHHPVIFDAPKSIVQSTPQGKLLSSVIKNHINVLSMHTNLDVVKGGVNDVLAQLLDIGELKMLSGGGVDNSGDEYGFGRLGYVNFTSAANFAAFLKERLGCKAIKYYDAGKRVRYVALLAGSGGSFLSKAISAGCDTFITGDVKHDVFIDAANYGINLFDAGHYATEFPVCPLLVRLLKTEFPDLDIRLSKRDVELPSYVV